MSEFAGLSYYAEVPAVVFDIQRVGPSTGLPTRTAQGDLLFAAFNSHGDTRHVLLLPASVEECYEMAMDAFDLAERLQTIVYVMSDLDLGMNTWMSPTVHVSRRGRSIAARCSTKPRCASWPPRGAATRTWTATACRGGRFPGRRRPAFFTRGSGHNEMAQYTERPDDYVKNMDRLARKFDTARTLVPQPVVERDAAGVGRHHRVRLEPLGGRGVARPAARGSRAPDVVSAASARIRSRRPWTTSSASTIASTSSSRTATRRC